MSEKPAERPAAARELVELVKVVHPGLNRHDRRAEARQMMRQAKRRVRADRGGEGS